MQIGRPGRVERKKNKKVSRVPNVKSLFFII